MGPRAGHDREPAENWAPVMCAPEGRWLRFGRAVSIAPNRPGIYEIQIGRIKLKVGIAGNLRRRLRQHACSRQQYLVSEDPEPWLDPSQVRSRASILAKHLYFDRSIAPGFDLRAEEGRRTFLAQNCKVRFEETMTREQARIRERELEASNAYRYFGPVVIR